MSAPTKERSDAREVQTLDSAPPRMRHILSLDPARSLCGETRPTPTKRPRGWGLAGVDCVVCTDLWLNLSAADRGAIIGYWLAA